MVSYSISGKKCLLSFKVDFDASDAIISSNLGKHIKQPAKFILGKLSTQKH
jgi:hypothetical protein